MTLKETLAKIRETPLTEEQKKLLRTPDVFKTLSHDELVRRAEAVSMHILRKNRKAYESLADK